MYRNSVKHIWPIDVDTVHIEMIYPVPVYPCPNFDSVNEVISSLKISQKNYIESLFVARVNFIKHDQGHESCHKARQFFWHERGTKRNGIRAAGTGMVTLGLRIVRRLNIRVGRGR